MSNDNSQAAAPPADNVNGINRQNPSKAELLEILDALVAEVEAGTLKAIIFALQPEGSNKAMVERFGPDGMIVDMSTALLDKMGKLPVAMANSRARGSAAVH